MKVDDLFYVVRTTMPPNAAQGLSLADHAAVVALILTGNGYAAGTTTLAVGSSGLDQTFPWAGKFRSSFGRADDLATPAGQEEFIAGAPGAELQNTGPDQAALNAASRSTDWLLHAHDYAGTRYSPLNHINRDNASRLAPACIYQVSETGNFHTGPLVYNGVMYLTIRQTTIAIDATTCKPKWKETWAPRGNTVWENNRGLAIKDGYVVRGTSDGYLVAMNARTGALVWARRVADEHQIHGSPAWRFNTVPQRGEPGCETWRNPAGIPMGGGAVWTVVGAEARFVRQHLVAHELGGRLAEEALLVGEVLARDDLVRIERAKKERPAAHYLVHLRHNRLPLGLGPAAVSVDSTVGVVPLPTRARLTGRTDRQQKASAHAERRVEREGARARRAVRGRVG